jgi:CheY-like chemotaxis protein
MSETQRTPKRILVVDDEEDIVSYLCTLLEDSGYTTVSASNGEEGLIMAKREKPDLITVDISMPEKSGVKLYRELRGDPDLGDTPVVIVTGVLKEFEGFISSRKQVPPPDGYIAKPIQKEELLGTIAKLLGR